MAILPVHRCSPADLEAVMNLTGDDSVAATVCATYDVASLGPQSAMIRYLASPTNSAGGLQLGFSINTMFMLFSSYFVFIMQAGFALVRNADSRHMRTDAYGPVSHLGMSYLYSMYDSSYALPQLCAGHVRSKNNKNILLKNTMDCVLGTVCYFLVG